MKCHKESGIQKNIFFNIKIGKLNNLFTLKHKNQAHIEFGKHAPLGNAVANNR